MLSTQMTPSGRRGSSIWSAGGASPRSLRYGDDGRLSVPNHSAEWRRALKMLADLPEGSTEALLLAHGFTSAMIAGLVHTELATSTTEPILAGGRPVEVTRISITYRGRVALERRAKPPER